MAFDMTALIKNPFLWFGVIALIGLIGVFRVGKGVKVAGFSKVVVGTVLSALVVVAIWQTGLLAQVGIGKTLAVGDGISQPITPPSNNLVQPAPEQQVETKLVGGEVCRVQSDGSNSQDVAIRNKENSSLAYLTSTVSAEPPLGSGKTTFDTATTTSGASLSYVTLNVPGCEKGTMYVLGTSGVGVASSSAPFSSFQEVVKNEILSANSNVLSVIGRTSALAGASNGQVNGSVNTALGTGDASPESPDLISGAGANDGTAYFQNTSLASGGSVNGYLDYSVNGTASVHGAYQASDGVLFSYDSGTASVYSANSFSFQDLAGIGLIEATCPNSITANRNAEKCWSARTLKGTDGEIRTKFKLTADLADPVASNTAPILCVDDKVYFRDTNGKIAYDFFSSSGTNQGTGGTCVRFVVI